MKCDFDKVIKEGIDRKDVRWFSKTIDAISEKYGISHKTIYNRFKSIYGKNPRSVITESIYPTKEVMDSVVLGSCSSEEVRKKLGLSNRLYVGIYDKYYGVSTFQKARLHILNRKSLAPVIQREDNRALIYSQILGDGSYCQKRHAIKIVHGERQAEYLKWKVSMLNAAYPKTATKITECLHKQGHKYFSYYTALGNVDIPQEEDCVPLLTPRGWLLWWLDDGTCGQNLSISCKRSKEVRSAALSELRTYGISAREDGVSIIMAGQENDLLFYKNFIEPFVNEIPNCMMYKVEEIVGRVVI